MTTKNKTVGKHAAVVVGVAMVWSCAVAGTDAIPSLIPMPREMKLTGGSVALAVTNSPQVEVVASIPPEGYELSITKDGVSIRHSDGGGPMDVSRSGEARLRRFLRACGGTPPPPDS